jgi:hypothetical protein
MPPSPKPMLQAVSRAHFAEATARLTEYVAAVESSIQAAPAESPHLLLAALGQLEQARCLALCARATLDAQLKGLKTASRYTAKPAPGSSVSVSG